LVGDWDGLLVDGELLGNSVGIMEGNKDGTFVGEIVVVGTKLKDGVALGCTE
jgi:hypothetical protein